MNEYKHYIRVSEEGFVTKAFSNAFEQPLDTDICVNEDGGRHYNLNLNREDGLSKYKFADGVFTETTDEDFTQEITKRDLEVEHQECINYLENTKWVFDKKEDGFDITKHQDILDKRVVTRNRMNEIQIELNE